MVGGDLRRRPSARPAADAGEQSGENIAEELDGRKPNSSEGGVENESLLSAATGEKAKSADGGEREPEKESTKKEQAKKKKLPLWLRLVKSFSLLLPMLILGYLVNPKFAVVNPAIYVPDPMPERDGIYAPNALLGSARKFASGLLPGAQDILFAPDGSILAGSLDGKIRRIAPDQTVEEYVDIGAAVLGLAWAPSGDLIVCAGEKGLLQVDAARRVEVLSTHADGTPFRMVHSAAVASDGLVYFTDASARFPASEAHLEGLEMGLTGRLLVYSPHSRSTQVLVGLIALASGVALSAEEDFVLVGDAFRYRLVRYWLKGEQRGTGDYALASLPGFPGKLASNRDGTFWLALTARRSRGYDSLQGLPLVKTALSHFPHRWWWKPDPSGWVLRVNQDGHVIESLEDPEGTVATKLTAVREHDSKLYFSGSDAGYIGVLDVV